MSLESALAKAQNVVPECVAIGYVDMNTGMLLGAKTVDAHPEDVLDLVAAATADLFQGASVSSIESLFRKSRKEQEEGAHDFQEILVVSENLLHVFLRCKQNADQAVVFVARATVNIGMAVSKSRSILPELEAVA